MIGKSDDVEPEFLAGFDDFDISIEVCRLMDVAVRLELVSDEDVRFRFGSSKDDYGNSLQNGIGLDFGKYFPSVFPW